MAYNQRQPMNFFLLLTGMLSFYPISTNTAKILLYPTDCGFNSRVLNLAKLGAYLQDDGHHVSIILNQAILDKHNPKHLNIIKYELPKGIQLATDPEIVAEFENIMNSYLSALKIFDFWGRFTAPFCEATISDSALMKRLKAEQYDLLIVDYGNECGRILSDYLDITIILYSNHGFHANDLQYPRLASFVCDSVNTMCTSDVMSFRERLANLVFSVAYDNILYPLSLYHFQEIRNRHGLNTSINILNPIRYRKSIMIINVDFVLDYPRPLMPHVFPISGLYKRAPVPLPDDLAQVIDNPQYDSVVVVSFGTLVDKVTPDRAEIMARIFSKLPAVVIWRFTSDPPKALGANTKLVGWFPQYDVLAHPKTKLFITHCGVSASFEAATLGIPVVALPMLADQRYHAIQLVNRLKIGVLSDWVNFNEAKFEEDVFSVYGNDGYVKRAKEVSNLMNDQDIEPKQKFLHLVNFTIRHNGAEHLISGPARTLSVFQFYSVDVIAFLLFLIILFMFVLIYACRLVLCSRGAIKTKVKKN